MLHDIAYETIILNYKRGVSLVSLPLLGAPVKMPTTHVYSILVLLPRHAVVAFSGKLREEIIF